MILLTRKEVACLLNVKIDWLAKAAMRNEGPPFIYLSPGAIRYDQAELKRWLANRNQVVTPTQRADLRRKVAA